MVLSAFVIFGSGPPKLDWIMQSSAKTVQEYLKELPAASQTSDFSLLAPRALSRG